jgi:hypothetical protein
MSLGGILLCFTGMPFSISSLFSSLYIQVWKSYLPALVHSQSGKYSHCQLEIILLLARLSLSLCTVANTLQSNLIFLVVFRIPLPTARVHRTSSIHLSRPCCVLLTLLQLCPARNVLSFVRFVYTCGYRRLTGSHHVFLSAVVASNEHELLPTDSNEIHERQVPWPSLHSTGKLVAHDWNCDCHSSVQQCKFIHHVASAMLILSRLHDWDMHTVYKYV